MVCGKCHLGRFGSSSLVEREREREAVDIIFRVNIIVCSHPLRLLARNVYIFGLISSFWCLTILSIILSAEVEFPDRTNNRWSFVWLGAAAAAAAVGAFSSIGCVCYHWWDRLQDIEDSDSEMCHQSWSLCAIVNLLSPTSLRSSGKIFLPLYVCVAQINKTEAR